MRKNLNKMLVFVGLNAVLGLGSVTLALADGPSAAPAGQPQPGFMSFVPFVLMFGVIYMLMIRPQQKRMKEQQEMMKGIKQGDNIVTASGILGKITGVSDKVVTVEVADNVHVKMLKTQVAQVVKTEQLKDLG